MDRLVRSEGKDADWYWPASAYSRDERRRDSRMGAQGGCGRVFEPRHHRSPRLSELRVADHAGGGRWRYDAHPADDDGIARAATKHRAPGKAGGEPRRALQWPSDAWPWRWRA